MSFPNLAWVLRFLSAEQTVTIVIDRLLERGPDVLRLCGHIWNIEQTLHTFWLEIARDGEHDRFAWFLYFDVAESSARRARNAIDNHDVPDDIEWHARLAGEAMVQGDALAIVAGSTRVLVRDMPEPAVARRER